MTSEAPHLDSPPPAVSVKERAKEIEARSSAAAKGFPSGSPPPVASQESPLKQQQLPLGSEQGSSGGPYPSRRCSEGDIFQRCKSRRPPPPPAPKQRRVSLENAPLPVVPERRSTLGSLLESGEGSCSGRVGTTTLYQTETTSKFAPFTGGGKSGVTCREQATADFRPAIFSTSRLPSANPAPSKQSPLDDIITALEKICDEFALSESVTRRSSDQRCSTADQYLNTSLPHSSDDVFEKCSSKLRVNESENEALSGRDVSGSTQQPSERSGPPVAKCQEIKNDSTFECSLYSSSSRSGNHTFEGSDESEPIIYRSTFKFSPSSQQRHVVSATLHVSSPKRTSKCDLGSHTPSTSSLFAEQIRQNSEKSDRCNGTKTKNDVKVIVDGKSYHSEQTNDIKRLKTKGELNVVSFNCNNKSISKDSSEAGQLKRDKRIVDASDCISEDTRVEDEPVHRKDDENLKTDVKVKKPVVAIKPDIPKIFAASAASRNNATSLSDYKSDRDEAKCETNPSEELEIVKSILANLDFGKYKRRLSLDDMEDKSPKPPRSQKTSSGKFKDFFDLLKPSSDSSSSASKRPFSLCRSSSFSNAETIASDKNPASFLQNEESDSVTPLPDDSKKNSTLPRRKSPARQQFKMLSSPLHVPSVASCPSIVKLESRISALNDALDSELAHDEGLVSDSEVGPGAYVTAYVSCVTSSSPSSTFSGRRGHVRSASDNVTSVSSTNLPEVRVKKAGSTEKLWTSVTSRLNGTEKRKRRKGIGSKQPDGTMVQEPAKSGTGRSLTYPPQRKSSTSEEEQEFTSVDSNGLKSLKLLTAGLMDSGPDAVRLLSDLSLADSHLCPSEGTAEETYLDVVDSVMHSPSDAQHLSVDEHGTACGNDKPHKKKHHSDPGGEACSSGSGDGFMADAIGSSRSEPDLGGNEISTPPSSSCSSASSETSSKATQISQNRLEDRHHQLKLVIGEQSPRIGQGTKHVRVGSGGSLTSGATPNSRFHFPDTDTSLQRVAIDQSSKSPQEQRRYSKRRLRGPYGEMLEEEMRKSGEKQKPAYSDLSFLQELCDSRNKNQEAGSSVDNASNQSQNRPAMFLSSQSLDDASSTSSRNELSMCVTPKRKISANYPLLTDEHVAIASDEDVSPTKPQVSNETPVNCDVNNSENSSDSKNTSQQKSKDIEKILADFSNFYGKNSDTRTHVVGELYDTEKSYVESLQILANLLMLSIKLKLGSSLPEFLFYATPG